MIVVKCGAQSLVPLLMLLIRKLDVLVDLKLQTPPSPWTLDCDPWLILHWSIIIVNGDVDGFVFSNGHEHPIRTSARFMTGTGKRRHRFSFPWRAAPKGAFIHRSHSVHYSHHMGKLRHIGIVIHSDPQRKSASEPQSFSGFPPAH